MWTGGWRLLFSAGGVDDGGGVGVAAAPAGQEVEQVDGGVGGG